MRISKLILLAALVGAGARAETDAKTVRTFKAKCASCHGAEGKGDTDQGKKMKLPDFSTGAWQKAKTDAQIKGAIENGTKKDGNEMDPYKDKLDGAQIDALVAYIRTLAK